MMRIGNDEEGFAVQLDEEARAIRVKAWGFWGSDVASEFASAIQTACGGKRRGFSLVVDAIGLKPQREPGQEAFGALMASLQKLGVANASVTTDSSLTRLQLLRIAQERAPKNLIRFTIAEAV